MAGAGNACGVSGVTSAAERWNGTYDLVIETGLGRAELFAPIDQPWLDLESLAAPRELPPGWELRPVFALGALFYPGRN
jgi:hypothetical protein